MNKPYPFTIQERTLVAKSFIKGVASPFKLEEVQDYLTSLAQLQNPVDEVMCLSTLYVDFTTGVMRAWRREGDEAVPPTYLVTSTGASQMASVVLPSRFFPGLKELLAIDGRGKQLATEVWQKFASIQHDDRMVRTVRMRFPSEVRCVIRSCHSTEYASYSNLDLVRDILNHAGDFAHLPVLDWRVTDNGMRLRFAGMDLATAAFMHIDGGSGLVDEPVAMVESWNSETGRRRTGLRGGMVKLGSGLSIAHWDERTEYNWIHRGDPVRISAGVCNAFKNLFVTAAEVVAAYKQAMTVQVEDIDLWIKKELGKKVPDRVVEAAQEALKGPVVTPGNVLASAVDAVAIVAKAEGDKEGGDMFLQFEIECLASAMLDKGLDIAKNNEGKVK